MVYTTHYQSPLGALLLGGQGGRTGRPLAGGTEILSGFPEGAGGAMEGHPVLLQAGIGCPATLRGSGRIPVS